MTEDLTDDRLASLINSLMIDKASYERQLSNLSAQIEGLREQARQNKIELLPLQREAARRWALKEEEKC